MIASIPAGQSDALSRHPQSTIGNVRPEEHSQKPLMIELFAGLHGWGEGGLAEGYRVIGFDIVDMCKEIGHKRPYGIELVLQDVLTLHGSQFRNAAVIVASPPCQAYSYRAMPWKRAKALPPPSNELFEACFRIQREASVAAGREIPLVIENVKGAQPWVGRAKWHYGSFYLWGDVPALMPPTFRKVMKEGVAHRSNGETNFHGSAARAATKNNGGSWFAIGSPGQKNLGKNPDGRKHQAHDPEAVGWFGKYKPGDDPMRNTPSHSKARKAASAQIAKIPLPLSQHIARIYKPV